jgi:uncharacterized protein YcgI (DUF1989 family)
MEARIKKIEKLERALNEHSSTHQQQQPTNQPTNQTNKQTKERKKTQYHTFISTRSNPTTHNKAIYFHLIDADSLCVTLCCINFKNGKNHRQIVCISLFR